MGNLSANFDREEFACKCGCGFDTVDYELLIVLEDIRVVFGRRVFVDSGCRCSKHNEDEGGKKNSWHKKARAADIRVEGIPPSMIQSYLKGKYPGKYGIGSYVIFTHIDTRLKEARWEE